MIDPETYLEDISKRLKELCLEMEQAQSTNICYGYDKDHVTAKGTVNMCLDYIKKATDAYKKEDKK